MEDMEQKLESQENTDEVLETGVEDSTEETVVVDEVETEAVLEPTLKKKGIKNFWKGVLSGALFSIVICGVVLVATRGFKKEEPQGNFIEEF